MAYGTPADPVAGTVITVAYAVANILDPIRALRTFTGGGDPPGSDYWLRSTSTAAVSWASRVTEVLAALGYTPVNKAGDSGISGNLDLNNNLSLRARDAGGIVRGMIGKGPDDNTYVGDVNSGYVIISTPASLGLLLANSTSLKSRDAGSTPRGLIGKGPDNNTYVGDTASGDVYLSAQNGHAYVYSGGAYREVWHANNDALLAKLNSSPNFTGPISSGGTITGTGLIATVAAGTAPLGVNSTTRVPNLNADLLDGMHAADIIATASSGGVPSGVIAAVRTASAIPAGWARFTDGDGRVLIGASAAAVGGVAFAEDTAVGVTWLHAHTSPAHGHAVSNHHHDMVHTHTVAGHAHTADHGHPSTSTSGPTGTGTGGGTGATFADGSHTHGAPAGTTSGFSTGSTGGGTSGISGTNTGDSTAGTDAPAVAINPVSTVPVMGRVVVHIVKT